jgi:hypothetical protein
VYCERAAESGGWRRRTGFTMPLGDREKTPYIERHFR